MNKFPQVRYFASRKTKFVEITHAPVNGISIQHCRNYTNPYDAFAVWVDNLDTAKPHMLHIGNSATLYGAKAVAKAVYEREQKRPKGEQLRALLNLCSFACNVARHADVLRRNGTTLRDIKRYWLERQLEQFGEPAANGAVSPHVMEALELFDGAFSARTKKDFTLFCLNLQERMTKRMDELDADGRGRAVAGHWLGR
jgi:hypothetical protein